MADDGSSVRTKVTQYYVANKLQELQDEDLQIKTGDLTYLQALPRFYEREPSETIRATTTETLQAAGGDEDLDLPPLFPTPTDNHVSWNELLEHYIPDTNQPAEFPSDPRRKVIWPPWYCVAIIGAGVAGLRTAKLLQDRGIPYKIFEASDRPGGRIFTYQFRSSAADQGRHDYYDVGAMRFPNNTANERTFKLFEELGLSSKLIEYVISRDNNIRYYNNTRSTAKVANTAGDHFNDKEFVPQEYLNKKYKDPWNRDLEGVNACTAAAFDPFRKALIANFETGWQKMMKYDWASTRSYLTVNRLKAPQDPSDPTPPEYPLPVVHWLETRNSGTGGYDEAFSEAILSSLEFDDPTRNVEWKCLEGGTKVLIDAMLGQLKVKPSYRQRVTAVEQVYLPPYECFPDQPEWPRWPRRYRFPLMKVSVSGKGDEYFSHVVSTVSFAELGLIDTIKVPMTYKQRQAVRTLRYGPAVKVAIRFKTRWWEQAGIAQEGGSSYTDRPSRVVVYPSYGRGEPGPGVLMVTYNWEQDASRYGALIKTPDWSEQLDPKRERPWSEKLLLDQIYADLAVMHKVDEKQLRDDTLDYHAFDWYHNPFTMGAFAHFSAGQFGTFFPDMVHPAAYGRFHFAGEVASHHHAWVAGALDSAVRVAREIIRLDFPVWIPWLRQNYGRSAVFRDETTAEKQFIKGLFSRELEEAELSLQQETK